MMESDADRLDSIRALGGRLHLVDSREVLSYFDDSPLEVLTSPGVDVRAPRLECLSSHVRDVQKDVPVEIDGELYRVKKPERNFPHPGFTTLFLKR